MADQLTPAQQKLVEEYGLDPKVILDAPKALRDWLISVSAPQAYASAGKSTNMDVYLGDDAKTGKPSVKTTNELKDSYLLLSKAQKTALANAVAASGAKATNAAAETLWKKLVDAAAWQYKNGAKVTPWDLLGSVQYGSGISGGTSGGGAKQPAVQYQKIDSTTANLMLQQAATAAGYGGKFTAKQVRDFQEKFNDAAAQSKTVYNPDGSIQYSAFDKDAFTKTWLWTNANFTDETTRGTAAETLSVLKTLARNNGLVRSEPELQATAKWIALGKATLDEVKIKWGQEAVDKYYPSLKDRYANAPGTTIRDLLSPYISTISSELEIPETDVQLEDVLVKRAMGDGGVSGKDTSMSLYDLKLAARNDPRWQKTSTANQYARSAAAELARSWGFGV